MIGFHSFNRLMKKAKMSKNFFIQEPYFQLISGDFKNDRDYIYKIFYPGSGYELTIYLFALFIGFFNVVKDNVFNNIISFLLVTFLLFLLIIFSKRVRDLGWLIFKAIK